MGQVAQASAVAKACYHCGGSHKERDCRHRDTVCHNCGKKGHLAKVCRSAHQSPPRQTSSRGRGNYRGRVNTKWVDSTECDDSPTPILAVRGQQSPPLTVNLRLNGVPVNMEVDTGATVSLMFERSQRHFFPEAVLERPKVRLTTYTTEAISVVGTMTVKVEYLNHVGFHTLYVVQGNGPTLLGRDWLQHVRLDWKSLGVAYMHDRPAALPEIVERHADVFNKELELMDQFTAKLVVKPGAQPCFCWPRPVPFAQKSDIEWELDRLEETGVLEKVTHNE